MLSQQIETGCVCKIIQSQCSPLDPEGCHLDSATAAAGRAAPLQRASSAAAELRADASSCAQAHSGCSVSSQCSARSPSSSALHSGLCSAAAICCAPCHTASIACPQMCSLISLASSHSGQPAQIADGRTSSVHLQSVPAARKNCNRLHARHGALVSS